MRKLTTDDVMNTIDIAVRNGFDEELVEKISKMNESGQKDELKFGLGLFIKLLASEKTKQAMYEFMSGPFELSVEEIKLQPPVDTLKMLKQFYHENDLKDFFTNVVQFMSLDD